ncbi:glycine betaine ABC transporter substrate-binding protein [Caldalkalibacillus salinus]|uniref:glycine betaine ABC transporter substrate-binding protein n=1 Tax=Caldalkalibacillus salinus TaxID=2803787 RepID=UPI001F205A51|nr:glycine betaine ABC transporter substrate-binding protein [Caldalkalibacillus salinus]
MKTGSKIMLMMLMLTIALVGCSATGDEQTAEGQKEEIVLGMTEWTSTEAPSNIMKLILEEAGYDVKFTLADQPVLFTGLTTEEIDFFMDAWLPYTEAELWSQYEEDLQQVTTSYEDVPLGWVVPEYVEEDTIEALQGHAEAFDGQIVGLGPGSGMTETSREIIEDYDLDGFELITSSEQAMMSEAMRKMNAEEPVIFMGWRPHSMFIQYDLKFLEGQDEYFQSDNVYVISYNGVEEKHPEVYDIMSRWRIDVSDLEEMMYKHENEGTSFEDLAQVWIDENRDKVDHMLGQE